MYSVFRIASALRSVLPRRGGGGGGGGAAGTDRFLGRKVSQPPYILWNVMPLLWKMLYTLSLIHNIDYIAQP